MISAPTYKPAEEEPFSIHRRLSELIAYVRALEERVYRLDGLVQARKATVRGEEFELCEGSFFGREKNHSSFPIERNQ